MARKTMTYREKRFAVNLNEANIKLHDHLYREYFRYTQLIDHHADYLMNRDGVLEWISQQVLTVKNKQPTSQELDRMLLNNKKLLAVSGFLTPVIANALSRRHNIDLNDIELWLVFDPDVDPQQAASDYMKDIELPSLAVAQNKHRKTPITKRFKVKRHQGLSQKYNPNRNSFLQNPLAGFYGRNENE